MSVQITDRIGNLRQPEYTGKNRCYPCTFVNLIISVIAALLISIVSVPLSIVSFIAMIAVLYLRGYVIPGTPELTARYMPESILRWFGKQSAETDRNVETNESNRSPDQIDANEDGLDLEARLLRSGIVEECEDRDDLCLTEKFERIWWRRIEQVRDEERAINRLAMILDVDPDDLELTDADQITVTFDGNAIGSWDSSAAFWADLAAEPTLDEFLSDWESLGSRDRTRLLASLRLFLKQCPACDGELTEIENVTKTCCRGDIVNVSLECTECDRTVFTGKMN